MSYWPIAHMHGVMAAQDRASCPDIGWCCIGPLFHEAMHCSRPWVLNSLIWPVPAAM